MKGIRMRFVIAAIAAMASMTTWAATPEPVTPKAPRAPKPPKVERRMVRVGPEGRLFMSGDGFSRVRLGVALTPLSSELQEFFGSKDKGVLVSRVTADSPAAKAGLRVGDVIIAIDGHDVDGPGELVSALREKNPGEQVRIDFVRDHVRQQAFATVEKREPEVIALDVMKNFEPPVVNLDALRDFKPPMIRIDPEMEKTLSGLQDYFDSPEWKAKVESLRDCTANAEKLKDLEKRMRELERKLQK